MDFEYKILESETCYEGFFKLERHRLSHTLFKGGWGQPITREVVTHSHIAAVLLYDPEMDKVVMIEQFRIGAIHDQKSAWMLEIIAGYIEEGETAEEVAHRESHEESGCVIQDLVKIGSFLMNPGNSTDTTTIFCGRVDASTANGIHGMVDEGEDIRVRVLDFEKVMDVKRRGIINTGIPIIALQWLELNRQSLRQRWAGL